ncbi:beta-glucoside kinase [Clostridium cavendishii DSM 21758]|uniref:Beta-glucoside kinase n=1 Tax=Clostridium cavendishii DSM 21758 TaxID=1121302 RepID=A0A1M6LMR1_9CLOT|nr:ROK family protein [Clostridium cavendishii]SHJ72435.1 beta-glucoside kinase [Clostridium cavendishii DSM 21758]
MKTYVAFDVGGTKVKFGIVDEVGNILEKGQYNTRAENLERFIKDLEDIINSYKRTYKIEGIAISMPGVIDYRTGTPLVCYSIRVIEGVGIKDLLEKATGIRVEVENDGRCAAFAEKFNGNAVDCEDFICLTVGTGIGGGIFLNGKLIRGHNFKAGEVGYMINNGIREENKGSEIWSNNASIRTLVLKYKEYRGLDKELNIEGTEVFSVAKFDKNIQAMVDKWYKNLSYGIFNLSASLNPQKVLIGGGISNREDFLDKLKLHLENIEWWNEVYTTVDLCKHKNDAGLIGAVYHFRNV